MYCLGGSFGIYVLKPLEDPTTYIGTRCSDHVEQVSLSSRTRVLGRPGKLNRQVNIGNFIETLFDHLHLFHTGTQEAHRYRLIVWKSPTTSSTSLR